LLNEVDGEMAEPFFEAYRKRFSHYAAYHDGDRRRLYITLGEALDRDLLKDTTMAVADLQEGRLDRYAFVGFWFGSVKLPEFDQNRPTCSALRKIAIKGGEWTHSGPEPQHPKPLPHLTDPLLFEPVRPREPEAADGKSDAVPR
jgi:hypothetical protein